MAHPVSTLPVEHTGSGGTAAAPIGVFDSGLGGLTVVREILRCLPEERVVYIGDTHHVPYGGRPLEEIRGFATGISRYLVEQAGCRALVMACNISSAVAQESVQALYPSMPVLGVIQPGARAAAQSANGSPIAVLATEGTVRSGAYVRTIESLAPGTSVTAVACPLFVPLVEAGHTETTEAHDAARAYLDAALSPHDARVVILGCTHYPFLLPTLTRIAGPGVTFIDPAGETVRELSERLAPPAPDNGGVRGRGSGEGLAGSLSGSPIIGGGGGKSAHLFYATGYPDAFAVGAKAFLGDVAAAPRRLCWTENGELSEDDEHCKTH